MSREPLLRGSGPTPRDKMLALTAIGLLAIGAMVQGARATTGGGEAAYGPAPIDPNAPRAVVLPRDQVVLLGLETPRAQVLAAEVRPPPLRRASPPVIVAPVELAEAPPPAMSAADAGVDVVAIEPIQAPAPVVSEDLIRPEAPENLRLAR